MRFAFNLSKLKEIGLDSAIAILGMLGGIFILIESIVCGNNHFHYSVLMFLPSFLYIIFRKKATHKIPNVLFSKNFILAGIAIFFLLVFLIIWISHTTLYYEPPIYFFLCSLAAVPIILHIFGCDTKKNYYLWLVLFEIIILSIVIRYSAYYGSAGIYGQDPWWHTQWIKETIETGHITPGQYRINPYYNLPIFHLLSGITSIISLLSIQDTTFISIGFAGSCMIPTLFIFLIARKFFDDKIALLSALVYSLSGYSIQYGVSIIPMTLGVALFIIALYLILVLNSKRIHQTIYLMLLLLFFPALILTHSLATLITFSSMVTIYIGNMAYNKIFNVKSGVNSRNTTATLISFIIFGMMIIFMWSIKGADHRSFFDRLIIPAITHIFSTGKSILPNNLLEYSLPYTIILLTRSSFLIPMLFAIFVSLFSLSKKGRSGEKFSMILIFLVLYGSITVSYILSIRYIIPWRWYIFMMVPLSIIGVAGIFKLCSFMNSRAVKLVGIGVIIISIIFLAQITPPTNQTSPLFYSGYSSSRASWTESEMAAAKTLYEMSCGNPITDIYYGNIIPYIVGHEEYVNMSSKDNSIFIWRNYFLNHPDWNDKYVTRIHMGKSRYNYGEEGYISDFVKEYGIETECAPLIYTNGNVKAYALSYRGC